MDTRDEGHCQGAGRPCRPAEAPGRPKGCSLSSVPGYLSTLNFLFCSAISSESGIPGLPSYHRETSNTTMAHCPALLGAAKFLGPPSHTSLPLSLSFW